MPEMLTFMRAHDRARAAFELAATFRSSEDQGYDAWQAGQIAGPWSQLMYLGEWYKLAAEEIE